MAFPSRDTLDKQTLSKADKARVAGNQFLDVTEAPREIELGVGAVVIATGWKPYDVTRLSNLGAGNVKNCISNMQMERLASPCGPTAGRITRPRTPAGFAAWLLSSAPVLVNLIM